MPILASFGGRGRLAAVSCAAVCTGVAVSWHLRARRRAPDAQRASPCLSGQDAPLHTTSPEDCNAPEELAAEFQVLHQPGVCDAMRILTRRGFQEAARRASLPNVSASDEQRLQLYALYKQATVGACATPPPSRLDFVAHAKW